MKTRILSAEAIGEAVEALRSGAAVALPTETVYGLAADALNPEATVKVFEAKGRPRFDPLIIHVPELGWVEKLTIIDPSQRELVETLISHFWPGPLTVVLPRTSIVPDMVAAGLETVALRMSAHLIFRRIVQEFGRPLAAPSANRFGRISPTTAQHVLAELDGQIPLIVDAGPTEHGLESTIVAVRDQRIEILRPGPISEEMLVPFGEIRAARQRERPEAPGQLLSHYAPRTPLIIAADLASFVSPATALRIGALAWRTRDTDRFATVRTLSETGDMRQAAANLFRCLRELDEAGLDLIVAEELPETGLGIAIMDRLRRAATQV